MTTITATRPPSAAVEPATDRVQPRPGWLQALATLARRRLSLTARTPRELIVPVTTPVLFAVIIAPALADTLGRSAGGIDYMTFVAVSTIGLLVPISCLTSGLGVLVDRISGARPDLLAAPIPRPLIVAGNLVVALLLSGLQLAALLTASVLRGAEFDLRLTGVAWFVAAALGFAIAMYAVAETLANRMPTQEEYIGALPVVAIVPWFLGGSLFPISAMPAGLTAVAKVVPLTHVLALLRYGLVDRKGTGLHDIWGMSNPTTMAALSMGVVVVFALALTAVSIRTFNKAAVK